MSVVARFREVAAREGARVAIEDESRHVTYAELDTRARAIAAYLGARGIGREDVVAIASDDRVAIASGMLGAWCAGAAFVVITSDVPRARATEMLRDARVRETLGDRVLSGDLPLPNEDVARDVRDEDLAYVVFTSGTTGTPKGVLVTHAGIVPMLDAQIAAFELAPGARAIWMLSPLFDASISDVFTALLSGATLVVSDVRGLAPRDFASRIEALGITHADLPPSLLALLADHLPRTLRTIVVGGEACADHVVARVGPRVRLVNVYGPTEATVCTSMNVCAPGARHGARIGVPLAHVTYRVEDGELLIGGACLARGYASDDALTAKRFVVRDGVRFYRTGDRVRARDARELEMVGRVDRQVKIAGVRIEPEEIEAKLRADEDVIEAAVVANRALDAFVVLRAPAQIEAVRVRLASRVPRWFVPSRFVVVDALPRTPSGKVDHAALVATPIVAGDDASGALGVIAEALASALGRDRFGADEDFVAAGADSLALLAACAAADAHGVILSPETIAAQRTARRIAACRELAGASTVDLARDVASIARDVTPLARPARSVFVTGATGTLGVHLVKALVATGASVTCLVRRDTSFGDLPRVRTVRGDVALERFGLSLAQWESLAREHDAIVHAAADLRLTSTYAALRATNVLGACHAADFANAGAPKSLHHVSTLSVFASTDLATRSEHRAFAESTDLHSARIVHGGYAQSKWAAEVAVRGAHVARLGLLLPARAHDVFGAFVRAARVVGCLPEGDAWRFDVTPVEFAARAIAHFVATGDAQRVRHVANIEPASMGDLARALRLDRVPLDAFRARVAEKASSIDALALASFRALSSDDVASRAFDLFEATNMDLGARATLEDLARAGIACPRATDVLAELAR